MIVKGNLLLKLIIVLGISDSSTNEIPLQYVVGLSLSPPPTPQPHSPTKQRKETSVAVKVLRSISSSLLPPLLKESENRFSQNLYRDIIVALQKISWKVEACLSFSNPSREYSIHEKVFEDSMNDEIKSFMIASPPEEPKILNSPAHRITYGIGENGILIDSEMEKYWESQRRRDGSMDDPGTPDTISRTGYFRPGRRTTVSISKRQVKSLGLGVVDATAPDSLSPKRSNTIGITANVHTSSGEEMEDLDSIRNRVLRKLAKEFPQFKTETEDDNETTEVKRPSTLPITSGLTYTPGVESRSLSAPLPPIEHVSIYQRDHSRQLRDMRSCEPPTIIHEENEGMSGLRERTKSLEFDTLTEVASTLSPEMKLIHSNSTTRIPDSGSSTMPTKRRGTLIKLVNKGKKKARSFGRADTRMRQRTPIYNRNKSMSEFFSPEQDRVGSESPIEHFSLKAHPREASCKSSGVSIYLCIFMSIYKSICFYLSNHPTIHPSIHITTIYMYLSVCLSVCVFVCLSIYISIYLSIYTSIYLCIIIIYTSICMCV